MNRPGFCVMLLCLVSGSLFGQAFPAPVPAGRPVIGIALEGGGARGLAHIGVLRWLEENRIPVDRVAGTSMGALVGALYASGSSVKDIESVAESTDFEGVFTLRSPYADLNYRRREDERDLPGAVSFGLKGGPTFRNAALSDEGLNDFLASTFFRENSVELSFDSLPIPFRAVATDLNARQKTVFADGPLAQAIRASISIPGVFSPVRYHDHYLVDGAMVDNFPTDVARKDLHADVVIGVELPDAPFHEHDVSSIFGVFEASFNAATARSEDSAEPLADALIKIDTKQLTASDYGEAKQFIQMGYDAAAKNAGSLRRYSLSEADWKLYLAARESRIRPEPGVLQRVTVAGSTPGARRDATLDFEALKDKQMAAGSIAESLHRVTGNGTERATYATFEPPAANGAGLNGEASAPDTGITVRLARVADGPPFVQFGLDLTAENSNVTRQTLDFRFLNTDVGGYGSEVRSDVRVGFLTQLSTQYYRLLSHSGYFIEPQIGLLRQPVYLWQDQKRISEHLQQQAGGGLLVGRTFNRYAQLSLDYENQVLRWHPVSGGDGTAPVSGDAQTATVHFAFDNTLSGAFSDRGVKFDVRAGALFKTVGSEDSPFVQLYLRKPIRLSDTQLLLLSVDTNDYFKHTVTEPLLFTVGGPLRLSAAAVDEFRGTDNFLVRAAYARRLASLPVGYGDGLYGAFGYEAAEIWSSGQRAMLHQDGVVTLIGVLPIGSLTLGGAVGDEGRRKVFVTFGRIF